MKRNLRKTLSLLIAAAFILVCALPALALPAFEGVRTVPEGYNEHDYQKCLAFLETEDENGVKNGEKLSEDYDPMDPGTWGVHMESDPYDWWEEYEVDNFIFTETGAGLRIESFWCVGIGAVGPLDVSGCTALKKLYCAYNDITEVTVSGCCALENLSCGSCGLTELDLSDNTALLRLSCANAPITELDLTHNTALVHLYLDRNPLTELDLSNNTELHDLICEHTLIRTLDLSNCRYMPVRCITAEGSGSIGIRCDTLFYKDSLGRPERLSPEPASIQAYPYEGAEFLGWYLDGVTYFGSDSVCYIGDYYSGRTFTARFSGGITVPEGYNVHDYEKCLAFLETEDENGVKNGEKLSEDYDPMDPETWGVHEEFDLDCVYIDVPTSTWVDADGELRLKQFRTSQWYGDGLVGALDFSGCTLLVGLVCSGNQLTCVDVSGCSALRELVCCGDGLTELDVSGNASLWRLYCAGNPLSDIDVSNNPNLSQLDCSVTGLTELDVSANPLLYQLYCSGNALTSLDLTANPQIRELTIENNPLKLLIKADQTISAEGNGAFGYRTETLHPMPDVWHYLTAYPDEGAEFLGWYDADGEFIGSDLEIEAFNQHEYRARFSDGGITVPEGYNVHDYEKCLAFLETEDENGVKNGEKLSENYDPYDPETWGTHEETESDAIETGVPTSSWIEVDGEMRLKQFRTSQWWGDGLVGELDFSGCTSLRGLACSGNRLTGVNVSGCEALCELYCYDDGLTELDVSANTNLRTLECRSAGLTELDLSASPLLNVLSCSDNELTSLDLTANTRLHELYCEGNPLKLLELPNETLRAEGGGTIGLRTVTIPPVIDTWYYAVACPDEGAEFFGWYNESGGLFSAEAECEIPFGGGMILTARFSGWDAVPEPDGDANGDGETTVADAILVLRAAMGV